MASPRLHLTSIAFNATIRRAAPSWPDVPFDRAPVTGCRAVGEAVWDGGLSWFLFQNVLYPLLTYEPVDEQPYSRSVLLLVGFRPIDPQHHLLKMNQGFRFGRVFKRGERDLAHGAALLRMVALTFDNCSQICGHSAKASFLIPIARELQAISLSLTRKRLAGI